MKKFILGAITAGAIIGGVYVAKKINEDIDTYEGDTYNEKAEKYFAEKWSDFKVIIEEKNAQIEEITRKVKEDVIKEIDELKRKELFEAAAKQIAAIKNDISEMTEDRRQDLIKLSNKIKKSDVSQNVSKAFKSIKNAFSRNDVYIIDEE